MWQHKSNLDKGFTSKYKVHSLVYYEIYESVLDSISREKYLKGKSRSYKIELIEKENLQWNDLYFS